VGKGWIAEGWGRSQCLFYPQFVSFIKNEPFCLLVNYIQLRILVRVIQPPGAPSALDREKNELGSVQVGGGCLKQW
jgi:hypothetical protein